LICEPGLRIVGEHSPDWGEHRDARGWAIAEWRPWRRNGSAGMEMTILADRVSNGRTKAVFVKHGGARKKGPCAPEYRVWCAMRSRCRNPNAPGYKYYGGRGITVCDRWDSFAAFVEDVGPRPSMAHTIDRFPDKDGNYEPGNVRWATWLEQGNNQGRNRTVTIDGVSHTLAAWSRISGVDESTIKSRLNRGVDPVAAVCAPARPVAVPRRFVTAFGRTQNLAAWAREFSIHRAALAHRLNTGMLPEQALTAKIGRGYCIAKAGTQDGPPHAFASRPTASEESNARADAGGSLSPGGILAATAPGAEHARPARGEKERAAP